jgi:DNA-binding CsgD family transcriptional regulator
MSQLIDDYPSSAVPGAAPSLGEVIPPPNEEYMTLLALSHTPAEHSLYRSMLARLRAEDLGVGRFGTRLLMKETGLSTYAAIRRACAGLSAKLSIEAVTGDSVLSQGDLVYRIFQSQEIFLRRIAAGVEPYPRELSDLSESAVFRMIGDKVMSRSDLSRREALVALFCAEGMSNAVIGNRLKINEKTVKYHLRHVFIKLGIRRRTELFSCLLNVH